MSLFSYKNTHLFTFEKIFIKKSNISHLFNVPNKYVCYQHKNFNYIMQSKYAKSEEGMKGYK